MRLPSFVACSLVLVGLFPSVVSAQTRTYVSNIHVPYTRANWEIVSPVGCRQDVVLYVASSRLLFVDTSTHSIIKEIDKPYVDVIINQLESPGCEQLGVGEAIYNLSAAQFTRNGISSAELNVDQLVISDPDLGKYVIDAHLNWQGSGHVAVTELNERFCDEGVCFSGHSVDQQRSANVTGTVTATIVTPSGSTFTADYSPSAGTQVTAQLENSVGGGFTHF